VVSASVEEMPKAVRIREVGPRDGFQNEPETIPTERKIELIDALARTGLKRLEVTSFVRAEVIPQLADAAAVLAGIDVPDVRRHQRVDPQRARIGRCARAPRKKNRRDKRLHVGVGDAQPQERQPLDRGVA